MNTLMNYVGERKKFVAKYVRTGKYRGFNGELKDSILVRKVIDVTTGVELRNHSWIDYAPEIRKNKFKEGDWLCFEATVGTYIKGVIHKGNKTLNKSQMTLDAELFGVQNVSVIRI